MPDEMSVFALIEKQPRGITRPKIESVANAALEDRPLERCPLISREKLRWVTLRILFRQIASKDAFELLVREQRPFLQLRHGLFERSLGFVGD